LDEDLFKCRLNIKLNISLSFLRMCKENHQSAKKVIGLVNIPDVICRSIHFIQKLWYSMLVELIGMLVNDSF